MCSPAPRPASAAPGFEAVQRLHERFGARLDVVVDACQMRVAPERVRACLEAGWMVLLTGSKFFGGPAFAGALLVPAGVAARAPELAPLPPGLAGYFTRPEWPGAWQRIAADLPERANLGLVLRWQAALWEMRAFAPCRRSNGSGSSPSSAPRSAPRSRHRAGCDRSPSRRRARTGPRRSSPSRCCARRATRRAADGSRGGAARPSVAERRHRQMAAAGNAVLGAPPRRPALPRRPAGRDRKKRPAAHLHRRPSGLGDGVR